MKNAIESTLKMAIELGKNLTVDLWRVCIPGISSAIYGFPLEWCAKIFGKTVIEFVDQMTDEDKDNLWEIVLCNIDPRTVELMQQHLKLNFKKATKTETEEN